MELTTKRLQIRPIRMDDKVSVFAYRSDPVANRYQGWIPENIRDVEQFIKKTAKKINQPASWFQLVLLLRETDDLIGDIGIHFIGRDGRQCELGITLDKRFHAKGYATEALRAVVTYLFHDLDKHRITASIDPGNAASIKLFERLGFRKEAHFRESLFLKGEWVDDVVFAVLKREWEG